MDVSFDVLKDKTVTKIEGLEKYSEEVLFYTSDGCVYRMYHDQDCCEQVQVEDVCGDIDDLLNSPVL